MTATSSAAATRNRSIGKPALNTGLPLPLERFYYWEKNQPAKVCFTQPMGHGVIKDMTWADVGRQVRSMAKKPWVARTRPAPPLPAPSARPAAGGRSESR